MSRAELAAAGALLDYVDLTQKGAKALIKPLRQIQASGTLAIDAATRRNLELTQTLGGTRAGSLLATLDCTLTGAGARLLAQRLASPSTQMDMILARQESLIYLQAAPDLLRDGRAYLKSLPDMARALQRLSLGRGARGICWLWWRPYLGRGRFARSWLPPRRVIPLVQNCAACWIT